MACSDPFEEVIHVIPREDVVREESDDLVEGIIEGLEDFAEGRITVFESDEDLEAYLMSL